MNVTDGILRVRYRDSWEQPTLMTPGDVYAIHDRRRSRRAICSRAATASGSTSRAATSRTSTSTRIPASRRRGRQPLVSRRTGFTWTHRDHPISCSP